MKSAGIMLCSVMVSVSLALGQGYETFQNFPVNSGSYLNGTFPGSDGSEWTFIQCRGDKAIELPTPCLGRKRNPLSRLQSGAIQNGCGTIIFSYRQAFSTAVNLNLLVNGELVKNALSAGGSADTGIIYSSDSIVVNMPGEFTLEFRQADSLNSGQVCIDNVFWTSCNRGVGYREKEAAGIQSAVMKFLWIQGRGITVRTQAEGEKSLLIYSISGVPVKEIRFPLREADLPMNGCPEGMYFAILRDKNMNMIRNVKLVIH
ncbi:MAG: hypothetical protein NTU51_03735 [Bacteroidetes bacterium]|nr:hypothetical protein [Bacteroidota bacterium]